MRLLCRVLQMVPARYDAWRKQAASVGPTAEPAAWEEALLQAFTHQQKRYATRRLRVEVHSDRGRQYGGNAYRTLLNAHGCLRSQSRRAECLDNIQAESLWSRLKTEELEARAWPVFRDLADAQQSVATYFDYYTHERHHSALAYQTPQTFYLQQLKNTLLNCLA